VAYITGKQATLVVLTHRLWLNDLSDEFPGFIDKDEIEYWELMVLIFVDLYCVFYLRRFVCISINCIGKAIPIDPQH
jgi:hypothetical protein